MPPPTHRLRDPRNLVLRSVLLLSAWILAGALAPAPALATDADLGALLEALVDLPDPAERKKRAETLARRKDISLDAWLSAMADFGQFERHPRGVLREPVRLTVGSHVEQTEITVYVPPGYERDKPAPLLLTLHGSGDDGRRDYLRWKPVADALGLIVISPTDQRGIGGFTSDPRERQAAWAALRWARRTLNVDESRIHATGISRGGHLLWDMALRQPDRLASVAPMIGGPLLNMAGGRNNVRYVENLVDVALRDLQGAKDDPLLLENLRLVFRLLDGYGARDAQLLEFPARGHGFDFDAVNWETFLGDARRKPVPKRIVRRSARAGEGRAAWTEILATKAPVKEVFALPVAPRVWQGLSPRKQREFVAAEGEKKTARLEARYEERGRFRVTTRGVKRFRLLLSEAMFDAKKPVEVAVNGKLKKVRAKRSRRLLLQEFAERFDRTFLPVAEIVLRP